MPEAAHTGRDCVTVGRHSCICTTWNLSYARASRFMAQSNTNLSSFVNSIEISKGVPRVNAAFVGLR